VSQLYSRQVRTSVSLLLAQTLTVEGDEPFAQLLSPPTKRNSLLVDVSLPFPYTLQSIIFVPLLLTIIASDFQQPCEIVSLILFSHFRPSFKNRCLLTLFPRERVHYLSYTPPSTQRKQSVVCSSAVPPPSRMRFHSFITGQSRVQ